MMLRKEGAAGGGVVPEKERGKGDQRSSAPKRRGGVAGPAPLGSPRRRRAVSRVESGPTLPQKSQRSPGARSQPRYPMGLYLSGVPQLSQSGPLDLPRSRDRGLDCGSALHNLAPRHSGRSAPLRRHLARTKTSVKARMSSCSHAQQTWGPCSGREENKRTPVTAHRVTAPSGAPSRWRCAEARLGAPPAGHAPPAACGPRRRGRTKRAAPIGRGAPRSRRLQGRAANPCIEMQIRGYKRGGASAGGRREGARAAAAPAARCEGRGRSSRLRRSGRCGSWLRPWRPAGTVRAESLRTPGRLGGTARCGPGPQAGRRAGGPGPGLSRPLPAGPEAPGGEEAARADQREPSGAAAAAGGRRGEPGARAGGRPGAAGRRAGGAALPGLTGPPHAPRRSRPRRCRPSWRTPRCWS